MKSSWSENRERIGEEKSKGLLKLIVVLQGRKELALFGVDLHVGRATVAHSVEHGNTGEDHAEEETFVGREKDGPWQLVAFTGEQPLRVLQVAVLRG